MLWRAVGCCGGLQAVPHVCEQPLAILCNSVIVTTPQHSPFTPNPHQALINSPHQP